MMKLVYNDVKFDAFSLELKNGEVVDIDNTIKSLNDISLNECIGAWAIYVKIV